MNRHKIRKMVLIGLFAALIAVFSQLALPSPTGIPMTLQTFMIAVTGFVLGAKSGAAAVGVYIAVGAVGIPVFAAFQGGLGVLFGPTGGFIFGFIALAFFCGIKAERPALCVLFPFLGLIICHICGVLWFSATTQSIFSAFLGVCAPYMPKDILSIAAAMIISKKVIIITQKFN